eukprot:8188080-Ditylum_brightwellii.AAC.1
METPEEWLQFMEAIAQVIKDQDIQDGEAAYLLFPVPDRVTATKIYHKEFIDVLEDGIPYQWKLEFEKE